MELPTRSQLSGLVHVLAPRWPDREQLLRTRNRHLRRLVRHAYDNVPYYRALFDRAGVDPATIHSPRDLQRLPITTRNDLRTAPLRDIVSKTVDPEALIVRFTSGSSGSPLHIRRTWFEERLLQTFRWRARHYFGLRTRDRIAQIGLLRPPDPHDHQVVERGLSSFGLYRTRQLNCIDPPKELIASLRDLKPDVVVGFAGVLAHLVQMMDERDRAAIRPRYVMVGGEVLTPLMRRQIAEGFQAPVREVYGSHEFNIIAFECRETGLLHICDDALCVEVLKEDGRPAEPEERGEVVITGLFSYAAPFIRYRLGDLATAVGERCPCGLPFSTLRAVQGRMIDYFVLPNGKVLHPYDITWPLLQQTNWLAQYAMVQERQDLITLRVVASRPVSGTELNEVEQKVEAAVGPGTAVRVELVPEIELEPNGKFRIARSLVASHYDDIDWEQPHRDPETHGSDLV